MNTWDNAVNFLCEKLLMSATQSKFPADAKAPHSPAKTATFVKDCYAHGIYYLQHVTTAGYIPDILKSGVLLPRSMQKQPHEHLGYNFSNKGVVYLQPYKGNAANSPIFKDPNAARQCDFFVEPFKEEDTDVILIFSVKLLIEQNNYYANTDWQHYGKKHSHSASASAVQLDPGNTLKAAGEVCFNNGIDLSKFLVEIWVSPKRHAQVVKSVTDAGLTAWLPKVVAQEFHPKITAKATSTLTQRQKDSLAAAGGVTLFNQSYTENRGADPKKKQEKSSSCRFC